MQAQGDWPVQDARTYGGEMKVYEYTVNEDTRTIYLPPVTGGPPSWLTYARKVFFKAEFGLTYNQVILNWESWERHSKDNEVKTLVKEEK